MAFSAKPEELRRFIELSPGLQSAEDSTSTQLDELRCIWFEQLSSGLNFAEGSTQVARRAQGGTWYQNLGCEQGRLYRVPGPNMYEWGVLMFDDQRSRICAVVVWD